MKSAMKKSCVGSRAAVGFVGCHVSFGRRITNVSLSTLMRHRSRLCLANVHKCQQRMVRSNLVFFWGLAERTAALWLVSEQKSFVS